ncbi:hypothetical protein BsWGS_24998 [Bradybaena similaris]
MILAAGTYLILTTGGIDDLCLKYFVEAGTMAVRKCKKVRLKNCQGYRSYINDTGQYSGR